MHTGRVRPGFFLNSRTSFRTWAAPPVPHPHLPSSQPLPAPLPPETRAPNPTPPARNHLPPRSALRVHALQHPRCRRPRPLAHRRRSRCGAHVSTIPEFACAAHTLTGIGARGRPRPAVHRVDTPLQGFYRSAHPLPPPSLRPKTDHPARSGPSPPPRSPPPVQSPPEVPKLTARGHKQRR